MIRKYVAREVVMDHKAKAYAYELLYRDPLTNEPGGSSHVNIKELISTLSLDFSTEELTLGSRAFLHLPREAILSDSIMFLEPSQYIFIVKDDVRHDKKLIERIVALRKKHFQFSISDYTGEQDFSNIEPQITYIKVDVKNTPPEKQKQIIFEYKKRRRKRILADYITTEEEYAAAKALGYDLFKGTLFAQPTLMVRDSTGFNQHSVLMLLKELNEEDADFEKIDQIINRDAGLTFRLLARGNTMAFAGKTKFTNPSQVVVRMGMEELQRWATLLLMQESAEAGQEQKLEHALLRAMFLESLAGKMNESISRQELYFIYLKGMLSIFPQEHQIEIFKSLAYDLEPSLLDEADGLLAFNYAYEIGDYEQVDFYLQEKDLSEFMVMGCYKASIARVKEALEGFG